MAGYIGKSQSITQVDGYNKTETDNTFVNAAGDTMTGDLNVTGTVTADGFQLGAGEKLYFNADRYFTPENNVDGAEVSANGNFTVKTGTTPNKSLVVGGNGDISFYEDTGTTAKFFWDASAESLGIGTSSPTQGTLEVARDSDPSIALHDIGNWTTKLTSYGSVGAFAIDNGGTERMRIDSAGRVTMPYQPAFYAHGNNAVVTYQQNTAIEFPVTSHNIGNHYNTSSSTFTAPVSGVYHFTMNLYPKGPVQLSVTPMINNVVITGGGNDCELLFTGANGVGSDYTISWSRSVYLNANDTFNFKARPGYADNQIYMGHSKMSGHFVG